MRLHLNSIGVLSMASDTPGLTEPPEGDVFSDLPAGYQQNPTQRCGELFNDLIPDLPQPSGSDLETM